jgi:hypothetical protein
MAATDQQMQTFANERIRPRAEQFRALDLACADDKAALDDEYARAQAGPLWSDARADGPPHLLASGPGSSPDDLTNYNALLDLWRKFRTGTFVSLAEANSAAALFTVLMRACVRPAGG